MVEIGRGEVRVVAGQEAPRAVVEALAGDVDVVRVQHAVDEARGDPLRAHPRHVPAHRFEEGGGARRLLLAPGLRQVGADRVVEQPAQPRLVLEEGEALEGADADVRVAEPHQHGGARGRGLVAAHQRLARLDQAEGLGGLDAERLQHRGRQHLAHAALEREPPVGAARPGRLAAALGAEVEQAAVAEVVELGEEEAAAVAEVGVVHAELVAVVAQRERLREAAGQRLEAAEMRDPLLVGRACRGRRARPSAGRGGAARGRGRAPARRRRRSPRRARRGGSRAGRRGKGASPASRLRFRGLRHQHAAGAKSSPAAFAERPSGPGVASSPRPPSGARRRGEGHRHGPAGRDASSTAWSSAAGRRG